MTGGEAPAAEAAAAAGGAAVVTEKKPMTRAAKRRARKKKRATTANAPVADAKAPEEPRPSQSTVKFPRPPQGHASFTSAAASRRSRGTATLSSLEDADPRRRF